MSVASCPRLWEAEAAHDGRLDELAHADFLRHVVQCRDCEREQAALSRLRHALCETSLPDDALQLRRVRHRMLAAANQRLLQAPERHWPGRVASVFAAVALLGLWWLGPQRAHTPAPRRDGPTQQARSQPKALRLGAEPGARFERERRGDLEYVILHEGALHVDFDHSQHVRLSVRTPDGEIEDCGTVFHVEVAGGYTTRIRVTEGAVRFRRAGQPDVTLSAGQVFERTRPAASQSNAAPHPPTARRPITHARAKLQLRDAAEDRAYLEVLDLVHAGRHVEARAAARRYCRSFPNGLRQKELEHLARSTTP